MRSLARVALAVAVTGAILGVASAPALSCTCAALSKPQLGREADVVFTGRAQSVVVSGSNLVATFLVQIGFKGAVPDTAAVISPARVGACGYRFEQGGLYTVFATRSGGHLATSLCSGTTVGKIDPNAYGLVPRSVNGGSSFLTFVLGALLVGGALWAFLRRRHDARWHDPPPVSTDE